LTAVCCGQVRNPWQAALHVMAAPQQHDGMSRVGSQCNCLAPESSCTAVQPAKTLVINKQLDAGCSKACKAAGCIQWCFGSAMAACLQESFPVSRSRYTASNCLKSETHKKNRVTTRSTACHNPTSSGPIASPAAARAAVSG
jgi:hypothetical protein